MTAQMIGSEAPLYAVCYDISDDHERGRADALDGSKKSVILDA